MKLATTTCDFALYCETDIEKLRELHRAGFRYVDLNMYTFSPKTVYMGEEWREATLALKKEAERLGMTFVQAHSQGGNPLSEDKDAVDFLMAATLRSLEICEILAKRAGECHFVKPEGQNFMVLVAFGQGLNVAAGNGGKEN